MTVEPPPCDIETQWWVHDGEIRVHRLLTRERFPWLHDLLASTSCQDEETLWESLDARMHLWQGRNWQDDGVTSRFVRQTTIWRTS